MGVLLERDAELATLRDAIRTAVAGSGAAVVVAGPAGIGKSSLLRAGTEDVNTRVLRATAGAQEADIPFEVVRSLFSRCVGGASHEERDRLLAGPSRAAAPLLGFGEPGEASEPAFALHGLFWLTQELAATEPLVLVVDDAQWVDEPSLRYLAHLARRIEDLPVALLVALRSDRVGAAAATLIHEILHAPATQRLALGPLSDEAARSLAGEATPELVAAARGNPFLLVSGLDGADALVRAVDHRMAEIGPDARRVGEAVALLEGAAEVATIAQLTRLPAAEAVSLIDRLASVGVLDAGPPVRVSHPLLAEALLGGLGPAERAAAHGHAAAALHRFGADPERVASHLLWAPPKADPEIVEWLRGAAASASRKGAADAAAGFLKRARQEPPSPEQLPSVEYELGTITTRLGEPAGVDHLISAFEGSRDPFMRADIARQVAQMSSFLGNDRGSALIERVIDQMPPELETQRWFLRTGQLFNDQLLGRKPTPAAVAAVREHADPRTPSGRFAYSVLAWHGAMVGAPAVDVKRDALTALGTIETYERSLESGLPLYLAFAALDQIGTCRPSVARLLDLAKRATRERGTVLGLSAGYGAAAEIALGHGRPAYAIEEATMALELAQGRGLAVVDARARAAAARAHLLRGELDDARRLLDEVAATDRGFVPLLVGVARAELLISEGDVGAACDVLREVGESSVAGGFSSANDLDWRSRLAGVLEALGEGDEAQAVADDAVAAARRSGGPRPLARALRVVALVGPPAIRAERLMDALDALDGTNLLLDRALTLLELGAHHRRSGQRRAAREHLAEALDLADRLGATTLASRAREELLASGARPRRARRWGVDALTPSELRIARLAARGMTNREIAAELFVTPKTVEVHLGRCYRKLGVAGREQLGAELET